MKENNIYLTKEEADYLLGLMSEDFSNQIKPRDEYTINYFKLSKKIRMILIQDILNTFTEGIKEYE